MQNQETKLRLEKLEKNAKSVISEATRDPNYMPKIPFLVHAPVIINGSADIGTPRARANHIDACMDYYLEEEYLKKNKAPLKMIHEF